MKSRRVKELFESMGFKYGEGQSIVFEHAIDAVKLTEQDMEISLARQYAAAISGRANQILIDAGFYDGDGHPQIGVFTAICALNAEREHARERAVRAFQKIVCQWCGNATCKKTLTEKCTKRDINAVCDFEYAYDHE